jgi:hypothetical protein
VYAANTFSDCLREKIAAKRFGQTGVRHLGGESGKASRNSREE